MRFISHFMCFISHSSCLIKKHSRFATLLNDKIDKMCYFFAIESKGKQLRSSNAAFNSDQNFKIYLYKSRQFTRIYFIHRIMITSIDKVHCHQMK